MFEMNGKQVRIKVYKQKTLLQAMLRKSRNQKNFHSFDFMYIVKTLDYVELALLDAANCCYS